MSAKVGMVAICKEAPRKRLPKKTKVIKTHDSESRGQEEVAIIRELKITWPLSELFTRKTAKKIANALAKLP